MMCRNFNDFSKTRFMVLVKTRKWLILKGSYGHIYGIYISCQKILGENMNNITLKLGRCMSQKVIVSTFVMMIIDHEIISRIILIPIS